MAPRKQREDDDNVGLEGETGLPPATTVVKGKGIIFVNRDKFARAQNILELVSGKRVPKDTSESERKDHYSAILGSAQVNPKDEEALRYVYETVLGGLVRTEAEQEAVDENQREMQTKYKRKSIES